MTDLSNLTQNDLASLGASIFAELNRRTTEHNRKVLSARRMGMGWITPALIDDVPLLELLEALVAWDDDTKGTLDEIRGQNGIAADGAPLIDICGYAVNTDASRIASRAFDAVQS
jgi:hypothetical protein